MNSKIYRQNDAKWRNLPYPSGNYTMGTSGCGACSVLHCIIEMDAYKNWTPKNIQPYMKRFAVKGHGTLWSGIKTALEYYGYNVHWNQSDSMSTIFKTLDKSLKRGCILFGSKKGPDGTVWTTGGHFVAFVDYKVDANGKHWFYIKDSGGRHHDKWWCYEKSMKGDVKQVFICTSYKNAQPTTSKKKAYSGKLPTKTLKMGSKGTQVKYWQSFLNWYFDKTVCKKDGVWGKITHKYTCLFQEKELGKSEVDGIVGKKTLVKAKAVKK